MALSYVAITLSIISILLACISESEKRKLENQLFNKEIEQKIESINQILESIKSTEGENM